MIHPQALELGVHRSCIRELYEYGRRRAAEIGEENVFDFSLGNPSIPSPPEINEAIRQLLTDTDSLALHGYTTSAGDFSVREAIAQDLNRRFHANAKAENLFLGCGAAPGLTAVFRALATENAEFVGIAPHFPDYPPFVAFAGGIFKAVEPDIPNFQINLDALEAALNPNTAAVIINSPNNPAGTVYSRETLEKLAALLTRKSQEFGHAIYIISDEPYRELAYGVDVPFLPLIYPNTVVCYSYSKCLSLPGERIGYIYVPDGATDSKNLYAAIAGAARALGHVCAPSLWQKVIGRCTHLRPDLESYDKNRRMLWENLTAYGYETAQPDGAFYLFVKAPGGDAVAFSEKAKQRDLLVVPGDGFGCPGYFRLCYCVSYEKICRSLPIFKELI